jgi:hypothetical protein
MVADDLITQIELAAGVTVLHATAGMAVKSGPIVLAGWPGDHQIDCLLPYFANQPHRSGSCLRSARFFHSGTQ